VDLGFEHEGCGMWIRPYPQRRFTYKAINNDEQLSKKCNDEQLLYSPFSNEFAWVKLSGFGHSSQMVKILKFIYGNSI
jgi:hypothetical protein